MFGADRRSAPGGASVGSLGAWAAQLFQRGLEAAGQRNLAAAVKLKAVVP